MEKNLPSVREKQGFSDHKLEKKNKRQEVNKK